MGKLWDKLRPLSSGQEELKRALEDKSFDIVGVFGPTGTGKSLFCLLYGIDSVLEGRFSRFIVSRPLIDVVTGREITATDIGSENYVELVSAYMKDVLAKFISWDDIKKLMDEGKVVFADTRYLRGRTFDDSLIFLDDSQNIPPESAVEIVLRIGSNSKFVVAGDPIFQRNPAMSVDGASVVRELLLGEETAKVIDLGLKDVIRPGAKRGIRLLMEMQMRSRKLSESEQRILESARIHAPDADIITIVEFVEERKRFNITSEHTPDALVIVKEGSLGRLVGRGGERIQKIEEDVELKLRAIELTLDFRELIRAVHPVSWIHKHVVDADFAGPHLAVKVRSEAFGAFVGQKGFHVKFLDSVINKILGISVRVYEHVEEEPRRKRRRR